MSVVLLAALLLASASATLLTMSAFDSYRKKRNSVRAKARLGIVLEEDLIKGRMGNISRAVKGVPLLKDLLRKGNLRLRNRSIKDAYERQLPVLIDVVSLGMQSGLSFESSFSLYANRFDTELSRVCRGAAKQLETGVASREAVLKDLADELECESFSRFVGAMGRSLRYGVQVTALLEKLSNETRRSYRSHREEEVAKAPIKMLIPTATLILPAMLILIAGPFLVEFIGQM